MSEQKMKRMVGDMEERMEERADVQSKHLGARIDEIIALLKSDDST